MKFKTPWTVNNAVEFLYQLNGYAPPWYYESYFARHRSFKKDDRYLLYNSGFYDWLVENYLYNQEWVDKAYWPYFIYLYTFLQIKEQFPEVVKKILNKISRERRFIFINTALYDDFLYFCQYKTLHNIPYDVHKVCAKIYHSMPENDIKLYRTTLLNLALEVDQAWYTSLVLESFIKIHLPNGIVNNEKIINYLLCGLEHIRYLSNDLLEDNIKLFQKIKDIPLDDITQECLIEHMLRVFRSPAISNLVLKNQYYTNISKLLTIKNDKLERYAQINLLKVMGL